MVDACRSVKSPELWLSTSRRAYLFGLLSGLALSDGLSDVSHLLQAIPVPLDEGGPCDVHTLSREEETLRGELGRGEGLLFSWRKHRL